VTIERGGERILQVHVAVAETAVERMTGLRGRALGEGEGLLIRFPVEDELCVLNEGVDYAIEAIWIDAAFSVGAVEGFEADDPTPRCHAGQYVLEVLDAHGTQAGDTAHFADL